MKKLYRLIQVALILIVSLISTQVSITKQEAKTSNNNLNKTLDLHAMALKIDEINQLLYETSVQLFKRKEYSKIKEKLSLCDFIPINFL